MHLHSNPEGEESWAHFLDTEAEAPKMPGPASGDPGSTWWGGIRAARKVCLFRQVLAGRERVSPWAHRQVTVTCLGTWGLINAVL